MSAINGELGELIEVIMGQAPPGSDCNFDGIGAIFVKAGEFQDRHPAIREWTTKPLKLASINDVLVCVVGATCGKVNQSSFECAIGRSVAAIRAKSNRLDHLYLYHFLRTTVLQLRGVAQGAAQGVITKEMIQSLTLFLPPLPEQRRIAQILDKAEALRAKRRAALAKLDTLAQSIFLEMFGDPTTNPKGWGYQKISDVCALISGYPFSSEYYVENKEGIRLCRGANVMPNRIDWSDTVYWNNDECVSLKSYSLVEGDILIAMDRPWISEGFKISMVRKEDTPSLLVQRVARLRIGNAALATFLYYTLNSNVFARYCRPTETTIPHISPVEIKKFSFPSPPLPLQQAFARRVEAIETLKAAHRASLAKLDALFASLQHRAFRGEL